MSWSRINTQDEVHQPFEKPWHAELFATTVYLCDTQIFSWSEWTKCLGKQIRLVGKNHNIDGSDGYYEIWLLALSDMLVAKNITDSDTIAKIQKRWADAYKKTPHGKPVNI